VRQNGCVYSLHTSGIGPGRMWVGSGRIRYVSGGARGRECSSSPTSDTWFPCSGACGPLNVYKSPFMGPAGPICVGGGRPGAPCIDFRGSGGAAYSFMAGNAAECMIGRSLGGRRRLGWPAFFCVTTVHGNVPRVSARPGASCWRVLRGVGCGT